MSASGTIRRLLAWPGRARLLASASYFLALNWLLLVPADTFEEVEELFPHQDKVVHFVLFLALAFLVRWSLPGAGAYGRWRSGALPALLLYAAAIEGLQPVIGGAGRQFDWLDMACNLAGVCSGWLLSGTVGEYHAPGSGST